MRTQDYDVELEAALVSELGLDADEPLEVQLERADVDATRFLEVFFSVAQPFVAMFRDILALAEDVAATQGRHNLEMKFDFGADRQLAIDLDAFRAQVERLSSATLPLRIERWKLNELHRLVETLQGDAEPRSSCHSDPHPKLAAWAESYESGAWPENTLPPPDSGSTEFDELLGRVFAYHRQLVAAARRAAPDRATLWERWRDYDERLAEPEFGRVLELSSSGIEDSDAATEFLRRLHSDHWALTCLHALYECADRVRERPELAPAAVERLRSHLSSIPRETREVEVVVRELEDLLRLPIWQRRSELYSIWILTGIVTGLRCLSPVELGFEDGLFDVPFAPKQLATLQGVEPPVHLWSELKTPLANPRGKGRVGHVQPDFVLTTDPAAPPAEGFGVVEVKQYLKQSPAHFAAALADYAQAHSEAQVVLVDYGPANDAAVERVEHALRDRVSVIGDLKPGCSDSWNRWQAWIGELVRSHCERVDADESAARLASFAGAECELRWGAAPRDLDLHVKAPSWLDRGHISYAQRGSLTEPPWLQLDQDAQGGHGPERIRIVRAVRGTYRVAVHRYSDDADLPGCGATVEVRFANGRSWTFTCPSIGSGAWWHVCDLDLAAGVVREVAHSSDLPPFLGRARS